MKSKDPTLKCSGCPLEFIGPMRIAEAQAHVNKTGHVVEIFRAGKFIKMILPRPL